MGALKNMNRGKAVGLDAVIIEILKSGISIVD